MQPALPPSCCPVRLYYSYARADEALVQRLERHLSTLRRSGWIRDWHRGWVVPGRTEEEAASSQLAAADIVLLLLSSDFMAADALADGEASRAIERHQSGTARVIPVLLRAVDWAGTPFSGLSSLPSNAVPACSWKNRDEAFHNISTGIREAIADLGKRPNSLVGDEAGAQIFLQSQLFRFVHSCRVSLAQTPAQLLDWLGEVMRLPRRIDHQERVGLRFEYELLHVGKNLESEFPLTEQGVAKGSILELKTRVVLESAVEPTEGNPGEVVFLGSDEEEELQQELRRRLKQDGY